MLPFAIVQQKKCSRVAPLLMVIQIQPITRLKVTNRYGQANYDQLTIELIKQSEAAFETFINGDLACPAQFECGTYAL